MNILTKSIKNKDKPRTANPATPSPITVPPPKDTFKAFGRDVLAASVVRTFASVAIRIPMFPATAENTAPTTNAGTIIQLVVSTIVEIPKRAAEAITTKMANKRYSALKNAIAPSLMLFAIPCILSSPAFCFLTHAILTSMNNKPTNDKAIGIIINDFIIL